MEQRSIENEDFVFIDEGSYGKCEGVLHELNEKGVNLLFNAKAPRAALKKFEACIEIDSSFARAYCNMGLCYVHLGQRKNAISYYKKALDLDRDLVPALYNLAVLYKMRVEYGKALTFLRRILEIQPKDILALEVLGNIACLKGDYHEAFTYFERALEIDSTQEFIIRINEENSSYRERKGL